MLKDIITKGRILETQIRVKHETKKQLKKQRYQVFLHEKSQHYPPRYKIIRWRNLFLTTGIICLAVIMVQTCFFYKTIWVRPRPLYYEGQNIDLEQIWTSFCNMIPVIFGFLSTVFISFAIAFDRVLYRRWQNTDLCIIKWT
jgi:hypothetical protein